MVSPRALPFYGNCVLSFQQNQEKGIDFVSASEKPSDAPLRNGLAIGALFEGKIQFTQNGAGYISESAIPGGATGFWIPSSDLVLKNDDRGKTGYYPAGDYRHLSYVGVQDPAERIKADRLVRVSLARWWKPRDADADFEERCYAQLSGWY